ncbi:hypothetical protein [Paraburkholderia fynbosensis]|uniref:hypothetical protein n=1 Tax=Paraburkholderia fynbosensis TaxID=1200993 RepID=UPI001C2EC813|nr:hypothetical protein [Paraburkholderia fynbosensis]
MVLVVDHHVGEVEKLASGDGGTRVDGRAVEQDLRIFVICEVQREDLGQLLAYRA